MKYMGGKFRQGRAIARIVSSIINGQMFYEPFCGAMGSAYHILNSSGIKLAGAILSDISPALINMWIALINGWNPPHAVTYDDYKRLKSIRDPNDPMTAYVGFGMCLGGKWWAGFGRDNQGKRNYADELRRYTLKKVDVLLRHPVILCSCDYRGMLDSEQFFYLDPPYYNRSKVHNFDGEFDHATFWDHVRLLVNLNNVVIVTEFTAPEDFVPIYSWGGTISYANTKHTNGRGKRRTDGTSEYIFIHESQQAAVRNKIGDL